MAKSSIFYAAVLIGLLIAVAYFTGLVADLNSFTTGAAKIINTLQGKNAAGNFSNYPAAG